MGCPRCGGSGYLGRAALYEMLTVSPAVRDCIGGKVPTSQTHDTALAEGMVSLLAAGVERARAGTTTLREVFRVVGSRARPPRRLPSPCLGRRRKRRTRCPSRPPRRPSRRPWAR